MGGRAEAGGLGPSPGLSRRQDRRRVGQGEGRVRRPLQDQVRRSLAPEEGVSPGGRHLRAARDRTGNTIMTIQQTAAAWRRPGQRSTSFEAQGLTKRYGAT